MGEFSASSSPWKKMVFTKSDGNEWTSNIKSEMADGNNASQTSGFSIDYNPYGNIKTELHTDPDIDDVNNESYQNVQMIIEPELTMVQEVDPLLVDSRRGRRRYSGPKPETSEERAIRLAKMSAYAAQRLANETAEQRAMRLKRMSEYAAKRLAQETSSQRAKRLSRMSAYAAQRLAKETPEQRKARLTRMSEYAARRHAMKKLGITGTPQSDLNRSKNPISNQDPQPNLPTRN